MRLACQLLVILSISAILAGCGGSTRYIAGSEVPDTRQNKEIIATVEAYRVALEKRDASKLLLLASERYWEDGGTPQGDDDYGYTKLKDILAQRLHRTSEIRYSLRYKRIKHKGEIAFVDVLVDASYTIKGPDGEDARRDMRDRNQFVLVFDGDQWKFISGM